MLRKLLQRFRRDLGFHKAAVRIDFFADDQVAPFIFWYRSQDTENDSVPLILYVYARVLYELAELNKVQVAKQLMEFMEQVCERILISDGPPRRPRLPLGQLRMTTELQTPALRTYQADFFHLQDGNYRLEFRGSLGKEELYLPGAFLALFQSCLDRLGDEALKRLASALGRLHQYYRYRRDFWDGGALSAGPVFALGHETLRSEEPAPEIQD
jgi:hypothetical protein